MSAHARELMRSRDLGALCLLETKTNNANSLLKMATKNGFNSSFMVEPLGYAGGLLLVWNKDAINFSIINHNSQAIHCMVHGGGISVIRVSFVYVRPNMRAKDIFWEDCKSIAAAICCPWIMLGDFNDIGDPIE